MAWTAPKTFTANSTLTASDLNTYLRDNMLETSAAKASNPGGTFAVTGANAIAERLGAQAYVATSESTNSATYAALTTAGPAVTVTTGVNAWVLLYCNSLHTTQVNATARMSYAVSSSTVSASSDNRAVAMSHPVANRGIRSGIAILHTGLTAGSNIFTTQYKTNVTTATTTFSDRRIAVIPF